MVADVCAIPFSGIFVKLFISADMEGVSGVTHPASSGPVIPTTCGTAA